MTNRRLGAWQLGLGADWRFSEPRWPSGANDSVQALGLLGLTPLAVAAFSTATFMLSRGALAVRVGLTVVAGLVAVPSFYYVVVLAGLYACAI